MKTIFLLLMLNLPLFCFAQNPQVACMKTFDEQLKGVGTEMTSVAGSFNYKTLLERATQCVQAGKCIKMELFISMSELMVDEEIIKLQREKVSLLKDYFSRNKENFRTNNYCAIKADFPAAMERMKSINRAQFDRFNVIIQKDLDALPKQ
jgi:MoaA/NifB/PqqE/SkfB family radical SAM enzyme